MKNKRVNIGVSPRKLRLKLGIVDCKKHKSETPFKGRKE